MQLSTAISKCDGKFRGVAADRQHLVSWAGRMSRGRLPITGGCEGAAPTRPMRGVACLGGREGGRAAEVDDG